MIKNYFKIAWRNLIKNKIYSFINIAGFSVGMAIAMLIGLWIWDELSFDKNFNNYNRIAQVMQTATFNAQTSTAKGNVIPLAAELRRKYPEDFKYVVLSSWSFNSLVSAGEKKINTQGNYMEPDAPDMLSLKMIAGSRNAFRSPSSVLLSRSTAKALFGDADPLGKLVKIDGDTHEKVAGIFEDFPQSSSFKEVSFIAPFFDLTNWVKGNENNWYNNSFQVFVQLSEHADMKKVSEKIKNIKFDKINAQTAKLEKPEMVLFPMSSWHLYADFKNGINAGGAIQYVWMFAIIGVFVLLLACINFMNLSTARSEKRAKEVGIRKAVGSLRSQLIGQFFSESVLTAIVAFIVSLQLTILILPFFNSVSGKQISPPWSNLYFWLTGIGFSISTGLLAGLYPAMYLSSFSPVKVLKGSFKAGSAAAIPRKILVVTQFTVSVILIISTIVVFKQVQFAKSRPNGYNKEGLITMIMRTYNYHNNFANLRNELLQERAITEMAESNTPITENDHYNDGFSWPGIDVKQSAKFNIVSATPEYGKTVGLEFVDGRDFSRQFATDSSAIIINETAAKYIGFKKPVGQSIKRYDKNYTIIGVIKDLVMESPYEPVKPTIINLDSTIGGTLNIRLSSNMPTATALSKIAAVSKKYSPEEPFDYKFADEEYTHKFGDEERVGQLSVFFAALAIFISCLGIFGMASFMAEQRAKEISVRKVLGASVYDLWQLQSKEFVMMVIISLLIASPVAWYFMHQWLQNYEYRTNLSWWIFAAAGLALLMITTLTVSYQTIKSAMANPVKSLRTE